MAEPIGSVLANVLGAGAFWAALSGVAGAGIGYYSALHKDDTQLIVELINDNGTNDEKLHLLDELIRRGILVGVDSEDVGDILHRNAQVDPDTVPRGLVCYAIWCSLEGKAPQIKRFYSAIGIYDGQIDARIDGNFANATMMYQQSKGLAVDGIIGAKTFAMIVEDAKAVGVQIL